MLTDSQPSGRNFFLLFSWQFFSEIRQKVDDDDATTTYEYKSDKRTVDST